MPDLFSEVELGEQRPKDTLGPGSSAVPLARASGDSLVDLHEGGRSSRGEGEEEGGDAAAIPAARRSRRPWSSWPHPLCNVAAVALGLLSAVLLVTTLVASSSSRNGRGPLLTAGQGCGTDRNCSASDGSLAPEGGLHNSVSLAASRDFRGRPRSVVVAGPASALPPSSSSKDASAGARSGGGGAGGKGRLRGGGVVAADHGRCSDVGAAVLSRGGNAADAAVAAALCQGVYNPMASGIGGGAIIIWRRGKGRRRRRRGGGGGAKNSSSLPSDEEVIDGRETAPAAASAAAFERGDPALSLSGGLAVATPMELAALAALFERHGSRKVTWRELVAPAARVAREGFEAHPYYVSAVSGPRTLAMLRRSPELRAAFLVRDPKAKAREEKQKKKGGEGGGGVKEEEEEEEARNWRPPRVGERCCSRPALADTLDAVGLEGASRGFYRSERAAQIAEDVTRAGGVLSAEDLNKAAPRVAAPLRSSRSSRSSSTSSSSSGPLWGMTLLVPPPPSAGASLLLAASLAAGFEQPLPFGRGLGAHRLVEAMKHGMALRAALGDPGGGSAVAFGCVVADDGEKEAGKGRRRGRRSLLAAACEGLAPPPAPRLFEGTAHVPALLADAADPSFAALLRSEVNDTSTHRDPASYGGRWGVGGGGDGGSGGGGSGGGGSQGGGGRGRRRKRLLSSPSPSAAVVSLPPDDHGTSALVVVDADRNAVSLTTTVNTAFGSGVYSARTGVLLNNQMDDFSVRGRSNGYGLPPGPANFVEPGKRPLSSMAPCMLVQEEEEEEEGGEEGDGGGDGDGGGGGGGGGEEGGSDGNSNGGPLDPTYGLRLVAGASGGPRILTALLQALVAVVEGGARPGEAVSAARLHHQLLPAEVFAERWDAGGVREEVPASTLAALESRGHAVRPAGWGAVVQAIVVPQGGGPLEAACDPRKDGAPAVAA